MEDLRGRILPGFDTGRTVGKEGERGTEMSRHVNSFSPDLFTSSFLHFHDTPKDLSELLKETTVNGPAGDHWGLAFLNCARLLCGGGGCSVAQLCPTLWDPMDCSTPGFPVLHHLPALAQTHVHWVSDESDQEASQREITATNWGRSETSKVDFSGHDQVGIMVRVPRSSKSQGEDWSQPVCTQWEN